MFFHSVHDACRCATCRLAVPSVRKALSSTGMFQKSVSTRPDTSVRLKDRSLGYKDCLERDSNLPLIRRWIKQQTLAEAQKANRGIASTAGAQLTKTTSKATLMQARKRSKGGRVVR